MFIVQKVMSFDRAFHCLHQFEAFKSSSTEWSCWLRTCRVLVTSLGTVDSDSLRVAAEHLVTKLGDPSAFVIASKTGDGKVSLVAAFSKQVVGLGLQAGKFLGPIARLTGGGGGGKPNFAQAGGKLPEKLDEALAVAKKDLIAALSKAS